MHMCVYIYVYIYAYVYIYTGSDFELIFNFLWFCVGGCVILSSSFCSVRLPQDIRIKTKPGPGLERQFKFYGLFCIALPSLD